MINITPLALTQLTGFLKDIKAAPCVRVHQIPVSCGGGDGQLVLSVDKTLESDFSTKAGDLTLVMGKSLMDLTGDVTIDFKDNGQDSGFVVESEKELPRDEGGCDGCSGCFY
ncbi:MAG: hypothetical protein LBE38_11905 [Deltaproteobacteria bacterium]|jgi:Fe-S cluster assembly iron-binding protein IscA|nr:hypothetical protein [Deltaproteobacteria bacterium]